MLSTLHDRVDPQDGHGCTPLHLAAGAGNETAVDMLINYGANFLTTDKQGRVALHFAVENGNINVLRQLLESPLPLLKVIHAFRFDC
jgi:ankyrin repeat protein